MHPDTAVHDTRVGKNSRRYTWVFLIPNSCLKPRLGTLTWTSEESVAFSVSLRLGTTVGTVYLYGVSMIYSTATKI